ncbi:MAG: winged helix-turn-helix domain-containing protein [Nanoarchaeota archaeon]
MDKKTTKKNYSSVFYKHSKKNYFYFSIISLIRNKLTLREIASRLNVSEQRLNYYIRQLKRDNILIKLGYGTWKINENNLKNMPKVTKTTKKTKKENSIRGHAFVFTLKLPNISNWFKREEYLIKNKISYKLIGIKNNIQSIKIRNNKIWLCNQKIVVYFKKGYSYFTDTSLEAKNYAIYDFLQLIRQLEAKLKTSFEINRKYTFRVSRQHYSLIKNSLARQYDREHKKLYVFGYDNKLWLTIDNSYNLHELEVLHPKKSQEDANITQRFFNDLRSNPTTVSEILGIIKEQSLMQNAYNRNIELHL